jgi:hypothetical protein
MPYFYGAGPLILQEHYTAVINHNATLPTPKPSDTQHAVAAESLKCTTRRGNKNDANKEMPVVKAPLSKNCRGARDNSVDAVTDMQVHGGDL